MKCYLAIDWKDKQKGDNKFFLQKSALMISEAKFFKKFLQLFFLKDKRRKVNMTSQVKYNVVETGKAEFDDKQRTTQDFFKEK